MKTSKRSIVFGIVLALFVVAGTTGRALAEESITGTITEKGEVIVLDAADGSYILEGGDMTPDMVGKKVKITGTVAVKNDMRVINVMSMEEVAE